MQQTLMALQIDVAKKKNPPDGWALFDIQYDTTDCKNAHFSRLKSVRAAIKKA